MSTKPSIHHISDCSPCLHLQMSNLVFCQIIEARGAAQETVGDHFVHVWTLGDFVNHRLKQKKYHIEETQNHWMCADNSTGTMKYKNYDKNINNLELCVKWHFSCVMFHVLHVTCHITHVVCHLSYIITANIHSYGPSYN